MMKKPYLPGLLILTSMTMMVASCQKQPAQQTNDTYRTLTVSTTDRTLYTKYSASIQGKQDVSIYPQVSGLLTEVRVTEGASVRKGEVLFVIDQVPYRAALETAEANVASAEAAVATAQMTADSKQELFNEHVVSDFDLQTARNTLRSEQASLAQARAELTNARNNLSYTEVKSPVNGTAGMTSYRVGALVSSSISTPLLTVSDNDEMYVYFSMTENQVLALSRQNDSSDTHKAMPKVELILSDGSRYDKEGVIDAVSGIIDSQTGAVTLRAVFPNPDRILRSGGSGNILFPYERKGCIVIPQEATYELQDKVFVYKVVDGKTQSTQISIFPVNDGKEYIVESDLEVGDVIIAEGAGLLRDGISVSSSQTEN